MSLPECSRFWSPLVLVSILAGGCDGEPPPPPCEDQLDLLVMIDNSNSMQEEQESLAVELPRLIQALASGDLDGDGTADFAAISSLHVGVISSDMGVGGFAVPTCSDADFGDDGVLLRRFDRTAPGCETLTAPGVFEFGAGANATEFARDVACVATAGTNGCSFEQQLDAVLKAISPSEPTEWTAAGYEPPAFVEGTRGHALGANAGFVRPNSILAALIVTDEEDCSVLYPSLFDRDDPRFAETSLNMRCFRHSAQLHPISRYVEGLRALRRDPRRLVLSVIAGVPEDLAGDEPAEYSAILADPRMAERANPEMPEQLVPSCNVPNRGIAFPPRRFVQVASELDALGAHTDVQSICRESFASSIDALVQSIAAAGASCEG